MSVLFLIIHILHIIFVRFHSIKANNSINDITIAKNSEKFVTAVLPIKLYHQKIYQCYILKKVYRMQNFVRFHPIEPEVELSQEM